MGGLLDNLMVPEPSGVGKRGPPKFIEGGQAPP